MTKAIDRIDLVLRMILLLATLVECGHRFLEGSCANSDDSGAASPLEIAPSLRQSETSRRTLP